MRAIDTAILAASLALATPSASADTFVGEIRPVNDTVTDTSPQGTVTITIEAGKVVIETAAAGFSQGTHLAHVHGFAEDNPAEAVCATTAADVNGDGIVDLIETREVSGVTMIPMIDEPASLDIQGAGYPEAGEAGRIMHFTSAEHDPLAEAVEDSFGTPLAFERRVVYFHGVPDGVSLPDTVRSLEGVPSSVTLPVACAELGRVGD